MEHRLDFTFVAFRYQRTRNTSHLCAIKLGGRSPHISILHLSSLHRAQWFLTMLSDIDEVASSDINEETALLLRPERKPRTPLPKLQLSIIMLVQICEPLASQSIYPYINQVGLSFCQNREK